MNTSIIRVEIEYNAISKPVIFALGMDEKEILQKSLELFNIEEDYEDFELIILSLKCQVTDPNCLLSNEILLLQKRKSTTEILINK